MAVAPTAASALAEDEIRAVVLRHIVNDLVGFGVLKECSGRNYYDAVLARGTVEFLSAAVSAVLGRKLALKAVVKKGINVRVNADDHVSAVTAVTAVGTSVIYVFFASEGNGTVSAVSCPDVNGYSVYKHYYTSDRRILVIFFFFAA
jgi:hypothetical protein